VTAEELVKRVREQTSEVLAATSAMMTTHNNKKLAETYRQMSGWAANRSLPNVLWIICLEDMVQRILQHAIIRFHEANDANEFEDSRILIDESFIRRNEHVTFWREWLRNAMMTRSKKEPLRTPRNWSKGKEKHPFHKNFETQPGLSDLRPLYVRRTGFFRSDKTPGLQIADICAHIFYRFHRGDTLDACERLRQHVMKERGREIALVAINETSFHSNPKEHVGIFDLEEWKRMADKHRAGRIREKQ
jgi:hypothetical protein